MIKDFLDSDPIFLKCEKESDFYGASFVLNKTFNNVIQRPIVGSSLKHGWIPNKNVEHPLQICHWGTKEDLHLAFNDFHAKYLKDNGYKNVLSIGAPYLYANELIRKQNQKRKKKSLLIMPSHTLANVGGLTFFKEFFENCLVEIKSTSFDDVAVCIHRESMCAEAKEFFKKNNIRIIAGAKHDDSLSLIKQAYMLSQFSNVATNAIGSHVLYALYSGCFVKISHYVVPRLEDLLKHEWYRDHRFVAEINVNKSKDAMMLYPELFNGWVNPSEVKNMVLEEIGDNSFNNILNNKNHFQFLFNNNIYKTLKWNVKNFISFQSFVKNLQDL